MDDKNINEALPDISGVFTIDENNIPSDVIKPDENKPKRNKDYSPILLSDPGQQKLDRKEQKKLKAQKKAEKRAEKRKRIKKRVILCLVCIAVVAAAVFGIKTAVDISRRPIGEIVRSRTGSISSHYDTEALLTSSVTGEGQVKTVAVFSENDYDIYSISKGLTAEITLEGGTAANGRVISIEREASDSPVMEKIREAFPDGEYSAGVNYVITVQTDLDSGAGSDSAVALRIITATADSAVIVPSTAVHKDGARFYVWTYKPFSKTAEKQEVSVGIEADGFCEISRGLKNDVRVVSAFSCEDDVLKDVMKIKVLKTDTENIN